MFPFARLSLPVAALLLGLLPAADAAADPGAPNLSGVWRGSWESRTTGHHGPMRARFRQVDSQTYRVRFTGLFAKVIPFTYRETLTVTGSGPGVATLGGSHTLGPVMGTFSYSATATNRSFVANYRSKNDRGRFVLSR